MILTIEAPVPGHQSPSEPMVSPAQHHSAVGFLVARRQARWLDSGWQTKKSGPNLTACSVLSESESAHSASAVQAQ